MTAVAFDTLSTARELESAGFEPRQAEAITAVMRDAVAEGISTKADIEDVRNDIAEAKAELGDKIDKRSADDVSGLKTDMAANKERLAALERNSIPKAELAEVDGRMYRALRWLGGGIIAILVGLGGMAVGFVTLVFGAG